MKRFVNVKKILPYIKCMIFIAGAVILIGLSDFLFAKAGYIDYILRQSKSGEVKYNEFILGASHARCAIDPEEIEELSDNTVLNMAIPGETIKESYYLLQELDRTNDIEKIVLDIDYNYWFGNLGKGAFSEAFLFNQYSWKSPIKWKYLVENAYLLDFRNAISKTYVYSHTIGEIKSNVKQKTSADYENANIYSLDHASAGGPYYGKGFFSLPLPSGNPVGEEYVSKQVGKEDGELDNYPVEYFKKIVEYCEENKIDLVCVTSPITPSSMKRLGIDEADTKLKRFFDELNVSYYDFNKVREDVLPRQDADFIDKEGHMGGELAHRYSKVLAKVLKEYDDGTLDEKNYFYESYDEMFKQMEE